MGTWSTYRFTFDPTSKERREGIPDPGPINDAYIRNRILPALYTLIQNRQSSPETALGQRLGIWGFLSEVGWYRKGKPVLFLESQELINLIYSATYDIDFEHVCLPGDILGFSFPEGARLDGVTLEPCILHRVREVGGDTHESIGIKDILEQQNVLDLKKDGTRISCTLREGFMSHRVGVMINQEHLDAALNPHPDPNNPDFPSEFSDYEAKQFSVILRLVLGTCAYISAFPECLVSGFPKTMQSRNARILTKDLTRTKPVTLKLHPRLVGSPGAHSRVGHFRTLRDDKFKRNPDGTYRVVYVSETFVKGRAKDVDPKTVKE